MQIEFAARPSFVSAHTAANTKTIRSFFIPTLFLAFLVLRARSRKPQILFLCFLKLLRVNQL